MLNESKVLNLNPAIRQMRKEAIAILESDDLLDVDLKFSRQEPELEIKVMIDAKTSSDEIKVQHLKFSVNDDGGVELTKLLDETFEDSDAAFDCFDSLKSDQE